MLYNMYTLVRAMNQILEDNELFLREDGSYIRARSIGRNIAQKKVAPTGNKIFEEEGRLWITLHAAQLRAGGK